DGAIGADQERATETQVATVATRAARAAATGLARKGAAVVVLVGGAAVVGQTGVAQQGPFQQRVRVADLLVKLAVQIGLEGQMRADRAQREADGEESDQGQQQPGPQR